MGKPRDWNAVDACLRRGGPLKHKNTPRGGTHNESRELIYQEGEFPTCLYTHCLAPVHPLTGPGQPRKYCSWGCKNTAAQWRFRNLKRAEKRGKCLPSPI